MMHTLLLFFAPAAGPEAGPGARPGIAAERHRPARKPQARPIEAMPVTGRTGWWSHLRFGAGVLAEAAGFVALIAACWAACWLVLPLIALLFS